MNKPTKAQASACPALNRPPQGRPAQQCNVQQPAAGEASYFNFHQSARGDERDVLDKSGEAPALPASAVYCPELGQQAPARLFHSEYNYAGTYSLCWKIEDDQAARARLRELRIFPLRVEHRTPAEWLEAKRLGADVFSCLITSKAHGKLHDADLVAIRTLLD